MRTQGGIQQMKIRHVGEQAAMQRFIVGQGGHGAQPDVSQGR